MAVSCVKLLRTVCPRFLLANRSTCLTAPTIITSRRQNVVKCHKKLFCSSVPRLKKEKVVMHFLDRDGDCVETTAYVGESLLDVALRNEVDLEVNMTFVAQDGEKIEVKAKVGDNLLDVVIENDVDLDGFGACEGTLACSTCHLIFTPDQYEQLPEPPTDEEQDMLDLAFDLQDTSRLGCQVIVTKNMDGWQVKVPAGVADAREPS